MYHSIKEFSERTAVNLRAQALAFDILARDMKREIKAIEEGKKNKPSEPRRERVQEKPSSDHRAYVSVKEAREIMGLGQTNLYKEINEGRLPVKKAGRRTIIAMKDIHAWFDNLPEK
jgi:ribosome-binding protein aMBF1 (putative translation factor)